MDRKESISTRPGIRVTLPGVIHLLLTAAVGTSAFLDENNMLFLVFASLVGIFLSSLALTILLPRRLLFARLLPESASCGAVFPVRLHLRNKGRFLPAVAVKLQDVVTYEYRGLQTLLPPVTIPLVKGRETGTAVAKIPAPHRGWARLGPLEMTVSFPPCLVTFRSSFPVDDRILVHPRRALITRPLSDRLHRDDKISPTTILRGSGEFAGIREFRAGDDPRHIHWKMSARVPDRLLLREFEDDQVRKATVYLESYLPNLRNVRRSRRLERAISFAGALVEWLLREGHHVTFHAFGPDRIDMELEPGEGVLVEFYRVLAELEATRSQPVERLFAADDGSGEETRFILRIGEAGVPHPFDPDRTVEIDPAEMHKSMVYEE